MFWKYFSYSNTKIFSFCWEHMEHLSLLEVILEMTSSAAPTLLSKYQIHLRDTQLFLRFWDFNRSTSSIKIIKFLIIALSCYRRTFYDTHLLHLFLSKPHWINMPYRFMHKIHFKVQKSGSKTWIILSSPAIETV